jgi:sugar lactone lactonase YvrE
VAPNKIWFFALGCLLTTSAIGQVNSAPFSFDTLAGSPGYGSADGPPDLAQFSGPIGIAIDAAGYAYVADANNFLIRKISPTGVVTTLAGGSGQSGNVDGPANVARFGSIKGIAVDGSGNVYVADSSNRSIRKVSSQGTVSTMANSGTFSFFAPSAIAVDSAGNVYVEEESPIQGATRKITPDGIGFTLRTASEPGSARFSLAAVVAGIALDKNNNLYVADRGNHVILKISSAGVITTIAGVSGTPGKSDGAAGAALFNQPAGLAVDPNGNVWVADSGNNAVRLISNGNVTTVATFSPVLGNLSGFTVAASPSGIAIDAGGNALVSCIGTNSIRRISRSAVVTTFAGMEGSDGHVDDSGYRARFALPWAIAIGPDGAAYVADDETSVIRKVTPNGFATTLAGGNNQGIGIDGPGASATFSAPRGITVDRNGNIFVGDVGNSTIRKITPTGIVSTFAGLAEARGSTDGVGTAARFGGPSGIVADADGTLYVSDTENNTIRKITPDGAVSTLAGTAGLSGHVDGIGSAARFSSPNGIALDGQGNLVVADYSTGFIRKVTLGGVVTTVNPSRTNSGLGADFGTPAGIAVDHKGNIYVADADFSVLKMIAPDGSITTIGGTAGITGSTDGISQIARFNQPNGLALDANDNLYIADTFNNTIRVGSANAPALLAPVRANSTMQFGETQTLSVAASGALAFQWYVNGQPILGATSSSYVAGFGGHYSVVVTNAAGAVTSDAIISIPNRLSNLSTRAQIQSGSKSFIVGFVIAGPAGANKQVLLRGDGPALAQFGLTLPAAHPVISLFDPSGVIVAQNAGWSNSPTAGSSTIGASISSASAIVMQAVGAFALPSGSADSAILATLPVGTYTMSVSSSDATGTALAEVYEIASSDSAILSNVSARGYVGTGDAVVISGFSVSGSQPARVLVRGVGPALQAFDVDSLLVAPVLTVYDSAGRVIATNAGWTSSPQLGNSPISAVVSNASSAMMQQVGAFPLPEGSADSAMTLSLPSGNYTAAVSGANGTIGVALVEVYQMH